MEKLVIIASRFPYPLEKGDKLRLYYQIKSLAKEFEIYLCSLSDIEVEEDALKELRKYCKEVYIFKVKGKKNAFRALLNWKPFQVNYFYDRMIHKEMNEIVYRISPDHIYYQLLRTTEYRFNSSFSRSVDLMDCFSKGYDLRGAKEKGLRKQFYNIEARRLIAYEKILMKEFKQKFIISEQDRKALAKETNTSLEVLSNGIDTSYFSPNIKEQIFDLVFVGNMGYEPNIYAVNYLLNDLLPLFSPDLQILIAGARPPSQLKSRENDQITVSGWMEDIRDAYNQSKIFLAPIRDGIGQQNKILEAMAMQVPCIVSQEVADGLDIPNVGEFLFIARTKNEYLKYIEEVLANPEGVLERTVSARNYIIKNRSWDAVNSVLIKALKRNMEQ